MDSNEYLFVDWRPVSTVPYMSRIMREGDWQAIKITGSSVFGSRGDFDDIEIHCRFVCRADGLILFNIASPTNSRRTAIAIARSAAYRIKELCGHHHVFDAPDWRSYDTDLTIQPVLCKEMSILDLAALKALAMDTDALKTLPARSATTGAVSQTPALLTLKQFYSRLFDRITRRAERRGATVDVSVSAFQGIKRERERAWTMACAFGVLVIALSLLWADSALDLHARREILAGAGVLLFALLAFAHAYLLIGKQLNQTIALYRTLIGHCAHGNTLSRVLYQFFPPNPVIVTEEFHSIIRLAQDMIDALVRRINNYYFTFSAAVALFAIVMSIAA